MIIRCYQVRDNGIDDRDAEMVGAETVAANRMAMAKVQPSPVGSIMV